jgi:rubrerythrin
MGNIFTGSEVVEIGIQIERNGRDFYNTLVKQSNSKKAQDIFKYLAQEEEKHVKAFQGILDKTQKYEALGLDADQYYAYMNALSGEYIFTRANTGEEVARKMKSDREAIDMGIKFEKDSIVFYVGIKKVVPDYDREIIDELVAQEQNHLRQLLGLRKDI